MSFAGAKIALIRAGQVLAYQRDRKPEIPYPGCWDLPGGGREGDETPHECLVREVLEEFSIRVDPAAIVWERVLSSVVNPGLVTYFFVAPITLEAIDAIVFGDEGERWEMMSIDAFIDRPDGVPGLQDQLRTYQRAQRR